MTILRSLSVLALGTVLAAGCASSAHKANVASNANPSEEIDKLAQDVRMGWESQYDVLARDEFHKAIEYLEEAREDQANRQSQAEILDSVAYGQGYLQEARTKAEQRRPHLVDLLKTRQAAIQAGAKKHPPTEKALERLDINFVAYSKSPQKLDPREFSKLQTQYQNLEFQAIENNQLGTATAQVNAAKKEGAQSNTPKALHQAELDLKNAENTIATNRNNPSGYSDAVRRANASAAFLTAVLATTKKSGRDLDEDTAARIVVQSQSIDRLEGRLGDAEKERNQLNRIIGVQEALENARQRFTAEEAEAFQQGNQLLIRLKAVKFAVGRAELPSHALPILGKVRATALELGPESVKVEGHTDSTGSQATNMRLSQKRAEAIAQYLGSNGIDSERITSEGMGFSKPIASNKTKEGRAQNRRVDILITPSNERSRLAEE